MLSEHLGPVARPLVQRSAARCADLAALCHRLADAAEMSDAERDAFLARVSRLATSTASRDRPPGPPLDLRHRPPTLVLEVPDPAPLRPETVTKATALLASHIGPIAALLVRKALAVSGQREGFFDALCGLAEGSMDGVRLRDALSRLA
jgi:serine/threonine-protein kinase